MANNKKDLMNYRLNSAKERLQSSNKAKLQQELEKIVKIG